MPQWSKLVLAILVPMVVVAGVWVWLYRPGPPDRARAAVEEYLAYRTGTGRMDQRVAPRYVHAGRPGNFTPDMSKASYGSGPYYETDVDTAAPQEGLLMPTTTPGGIAYAGTDQSRRQLPRSVVDAWCVQIVENQPALPKVVLVGEHQDLYNADWIVHEPVAQTTAELNQWLAEVGCNLVITP